MSKEYKLHNETFLLDDSAGCFIEVVFRDQKGHVGVNLKGTASMPYVWYATDDGGKARYLTKDGLTYGNGDSRGLQANLNALCEHLLKRYRDNEQRRQFKAEAACSDLHDFSTNSKMSTGQLIFIIAWAALGMLVGFFTWWFIAEALGWEPLRELAFSVIGEDYSGQ